MRNRPPLRRETTADAQQQIRETSAWLLNLSAEAAERFNNRLEDELDWLAERVSEGLRPLPDEPATLFYSRPVFQHVFRTGQQRRRRTTSGTWRIYYELRDTDGDGEPDTLHVLSVRHAAVRPLSIEDDEDVDAT